MTGPELQDIRKRLGWEQRFLAELLGYSSHKSISQMERWGTEARPRQRIPEPLAQWIRAVDLLVSAAPRRGISQKRERGR